MEKRKKRKIGSIFVVILIVAGIAWINPYQNEFLKGSLTRAFTIEALDSSAIITGAEYPFCAEGFEFTLLREDNPAVKEIEVETYKVIKSATSNMLFSSLSDNLDDLCLTKDQVVYFCARYADVVNADEPVILFLLKGSDGYMVANVTGGASHRVIDAKPLSNFSTWDVDYPHYLVVPKIDKRK